MNHVSAKQPNVLWICSDQQRSDTLGCYGNPWVATPNLDGLAESGALFENAFCQSPVCTPSRGAFLTGRYPRTSGTSRNGSDIPEHEVLVTRILADAGYRCGLSGKLHLSACNPSVCPTMERRIDDGYTDFHWSHDTAGGWGEHNEYYAWLARKGESYRTEKLDACRWVEYGMKEESHQTTWCAEKAINFIEAAVGGGPWLFSVNMYDPHHPFDPPKEYLDRYLGRLSDIPLPIYREGEEKTKTRYQAIDHVGAYGGNAGFPYASMSDSDHRYLRAAYWAMCDLIDAQTGRMLEALRRTGQLENTIVIFMSDHGEMLGDHGIYLKGPYFYEQAVKVPLIVSWPGHIKPGRRKELVELLDLPRTILEFAGLEGHAGIQGRSLVPALAGSGSHAPRKSVYSEYYDAMPWHKDPVPNATMLRTVDKKIVVAHGTEEGELYDLSCDPDEQENLWNRTDRIGLKADMLKALADGMAATIDPLPMRRSDW